MHRSLTLILPLIVLLSLGAASCSLFGHRRNPPPRRSRMHTATMDLTPGIIVNGLQSRRRPASSPIAGQPPLWLQGSKELALAGTLEGRTEVLGFSGGAYKNVRLVAADGGPGAPQGKDRRSRREPGRADAGGGRGRAWTDRDRAALRHQQWRTKLGRELRRQLPRGESNLARAQHARRGSGGRARRFAGPGWRPVPDSRPRRDCSRAGKAHLSALDAGLQSRRALCGRRRQTSRRRRRSSTAAMGSCRPVGVDGPIKVLGWAPGSGAFLYSAPAGRGHGAGVFRYNIAAGRPPLSRSPRAPRHTPARASSWRWAIAT